jgi:hypothetical protein
MFNSIDGSPTPISNTGNLGDLLDSGTGAEEAVITQIAHNMGNRTFVFTLPMKTFYTRSIVANDRSEESGPIAQRPLNLPHATKLAKYMLKGLVGAALFRRQLQQKSTSKALEEMQEMLGKQPYVSIQPMVCNLRGIDPNLSNLRGERLLAEGTRETAGFKVWLSQSHMLHVVDGQHRRKAMDILFDFLSSAISARSLSSKGNLMLPFRGELNPEQIQAFQEIEETAGAFATVQIECHLGLDIDQERQLFHDLNNLGKKVEASLALQFDNSNPVNVFIKEELIDDDSTLDWSIIEKDVSDWHSDQGAITRKDLVSINARLFLNKTNISGATPSQVEPNKGKVLAFWSSVVAIPYLGLPGAKIKTVAAQPVVLKALAKLAYDFGLGKKADEALFGKLLDDLAGVDFSHTNPMWQYYQLTSDERIKAGVEGLAAFLPTDDEGYNRDIGNFDPIAKTMRFGAKVNDIFPIIGDMIRWKLQLPSRHNS